MIIEKIGEQHRERKAMLYIRQSSAQQVLHNRESQALQYAMRERLATLGWSEIEIIDEDLGLSAAGGTARAGFERMVAEVCLGKVGAVAAREVSRFARNSRDWQQLVEMCRVVDTLLINQETNYAPRQGNDRLLLGLKGSLNEYELDLLRQRSLSARHEKARRGELFIVAPIGFIKVGDTLEIDPDQRVQALSGSFLTRSPKSDVSARHCCGFSNTSSICRQDIATALSFGCARGTQPSIISLPIPPMAARMPMARRARSYATTGRLRGLACAASPARTGSRCNLVCTKVTSTGSARRRSERWSVRTHRAADIVAHPNTAQHCSPGFCAAGVAARS
jgi:DNA invertase Pin-like site-specific DNA recombinase